MSVYEIDPLRDPRWPEFLKWNPRASVFHSTGWLEALKRSYDYEPVAYTTSPPGAQLANGWVFSRIRSWLTGRRMVSLPFSDHCDPLVEAPLQLEELSRALRKEADEHRWNYIEYRPLRSGPLMDGFENSKSFCFHTLHLQHSLIELFRGLHRNSTQRKVRRADREGVAYQEGQSEAIVNQFYSLLILTRRRHHLPPQPRKWFSNLAMCMGDLLKIRVASSQGIPIAGILTLRFKSKLIYKYGCADERFFKLGGMQMLLWRAIEEAKENCLEELDLGRSDPNDEGLILFKDRLGAQRATVSYFRYPARLKHRLSVAYQNQPVKGLLSHLPDCLFTTSGRLLYRHFG
jgi:hypothetical protein